MKGFMVGAWVLFTLQSFLSYVSIREYADFLVKHGYNDHCKSSYWTEGKINWQHLRVDYSIHCTTK